MAVGVTFVILVGRLDVSVGSLLSLLVVVIVALHDLVGPVLAMLAGLGVAAIVGAINGYLVAYLRLNSLVTTLGMYAALQGVANVASAGGLQLVKEPDASWFGFFGRSYMLGVPTPVWIFALVALAAAWVLGQTNFGRSVRAVGGNELASVFSSINAKSIVFIAYMAAALLTAIAAIILSSRAMSAQSDSGAGMEIQVLSAIFLGGTALGGGVGGVGRTVLGVIVLGFISNAMILVGLPIQAQWLVSAIVIILAVWFDTAGRRGRLLA
jgi:ribose/xylose/arabinose/galactoside ABC-type transport system permease subunit